MEPPPPPNNNLQQIKQKVTTREETRQWIQKKKQERYEAHLMEVEAKKQDEERKKQSKAEFETKMKQLKMKANVNKAPTQRPPSLFSKMNKGSSTTAHAKASITKVIQCSEKISPKTAPLSRGSPRSGYEHKNASVSSNKVSDPLKYSGHSGKSKKSAKENSQPSSIMNLSRSFDSKSSENWLLKTDVADANVKSSPLKSVKSYTRSKEGSAQPLKKSKGSEGIFSSRAERQQILESCKSNIMKPVMNSPISTLAPSSRAAGAGPKLSMRDLETGDDKHKETHKRKTDQAYNTDSKKSRSVLVSSTTGLPNSKYYHFSYVDPPPPSPLNVSLCSEFNETSSARALQEYNTKVEKLKRALRQEFTQETCVGTLENYLDKDAVSKLTASPSSKSKNQAVPHSDPNISYGNKSARSKTQRAALSEESRHKHQLEQKENRDDNARISRDDIAREDIPRKDIDCNFDLTKFRNPVPFNFTSTMKARLNILTSEIQREKLVRKREEEQEKRPEQKEDISDLIAQYVANCHRDVEQLKASCAGNVASTDQHGGPSINNVSNKKRNYVETAPYIEEDTVGTHGDFSSGKENPTVQTSQFNTFTLADSNASHKHPINRTYDRALKPLPLNLEDLKLDRAPKPLPLNVEDLKLQFRTTSSASSSCLDLSEVRLQQNLNTSQIPERDSCEQRTDSESTLVEENERAMGTSGRGERQKEGETHGDVSCERKPIDAGDVKRESIVRHIVETKTNEASQATKQNYKTYKVTRQVGPPLATTGGTTDHIQLLVQHPSSLTYAPLEFEQSRKKSAFYSVPPGSQPSVQCLTQPDVTLSPRRKPGPMEINFRRISSTPTSSLKSLETFKDSDSLSDIPQPAEQRQVRKVNSQDKPPTIPSNISQSNLNASGKYIKTLASVATQSSFISQPPQSQVSCESPTDVTAAKFSLKLLDKMIKVEEESIKQNKTILKLKSKAVTDKILTELSRLETEKKTIKEGLKSSNVQQNSDRLRNLKKRQRGLLIKLNQERDHLNTMSKQLLAQSQERDHLNTMSKQLLAQSQERIKQLISQYNHLKTELDTKAILKVIDDSFRFHDDVTESDLTSVNYSSLGTSLDLDVLSNVGKFKAFSSLPEGLDRGDMGFNCKQATQDVEQLEVPAQPKILKDQSTSPVGFAGPAAPCNVAPEPIRKLEAPPLRAALYPKYLRRLSSGSDDSFIYSHNETISDQSDVELRIRSLKEQLNKRKVESERLKKELKSVRAENLKAKEASLLQQIRFYDKHIKLSSQELETEKDNLARPVQNMMKPLILKPHNKLTPKNANSFSLNMSMNMSSLEDNSDHTHSSHDYHKEAFDTESDKLDASDSTNVRDKESNDSLEPVVATDVEEESKRKIGEKTASNKDISVGKDTVVNNAIRPIVKLSELPKSSSKLKNEALKTSEERVVKTNSPKVPDVDSKIEISSQTDEIQEELGKSSRTSETASEIRTELDEMSNRDEIVEEIEEEIFSGEQSMKSETLVSEIIDPVQDMPIDGEITTDGPKIKSSVDETINSEETNSETARTSETSQEIRTDQNTGDSIETNLEDVNESDGYEEKNAESEIVQVSFREKTVNDTFIVHEESMSFERTSNRLDSDIIEEEMSLSTRSDESPNLKGLALSPKEMETSQSKAIVSGRTDDNRETSKSSIKEKDSLEAVLDDKEQSKNLPNPTVYEESLNQSENEAPDEDPGVVNISLNVSDVLSPNISNISDLQYLSLDKDFLQNYSLIHLSPSKAPDTPFLHALNRDYQMNRKYQLEKISNDIVSEEVKTSIETMVTLYKGRRPKLVRAISVREEDGETEKVEIKVGEAIEEYNEVVEDIESMAEVVEEIEDADENVEVVVKDEAKDNLTEKIDLLSLSPQHQKDLSWTDEDDWYQDNFALTLQGPPAIVAEVLLQKERQIEQEIEKIERLTSTISGLEPDLETDPVSRRKIMGYPYLRDIPDKPPPPYIEPVCGVPCSEEDISRIVEAMVASLQQPDIQIPTSNIARIQMYYSFLYDLTRDVYTSLTTPVTTQNDTQQQLPWLQPRVKSRLSEKKVPTDPKKIAAIVVSEVCELLSLRPSSKQDSFILRWSRPKRDPVDEIIVQESKREELMWTDYHTEETEIKNQITELILDDLLADTVAVFKKLVC